LIEGLDEPFLMMNGDLLTTLDYRHMWAYHHTRHAICTLATFQRSVNIDLGVIQVNDTNSVTGYIEKPTYHFTVSTGIYIFEPSVLAYIPQGEHMDLPDLILRLLAAGERVAAYPFEGKWLDIGRPSDYEQAVAEFELHRAKFIPEE
jgi:NDP-sugar pyrophosphorylase family protein